MTATCLLIQAQPWRIAFLDEPLRVVELPTQDGISADQLAAVVADSLRTEGALGRDVILAIDGKGVLATTVPHQGGRTRQRAALAYLLEESLPLSAEEMVCDFVVFKHEAFGAAVETAELEPFVSAFQQHDVRIRSISPLPLLALQELALRVKSSGVYLVIWRAQDHMHIFVRSRGLPLLWRIVPSKPEAVLRECQVIRHAVPDLEAAVYVNLPPHVLMPIEQSSLPVLATVDLDLVEAAGQTARRIQDGRVSPSIELNREPLATLDRLAPVRCCLGMLAASLVFLLVCAVAGIWIRAERYNRVAAEFQNRQEALFQELYPGQRPPAGVRVRLESEYRKVAGVAGKLQGMPQPVSALATLKNALSPLPSDLRFRILEVRVDPQGAYLEGEVRQHSDADLIAARLRSSGFEVVPPQTERLTEKGVAYRINARASESKAEPKRVP